MKVKVAIIATQSMIKDVELYIEGYEWGPTVSKLILTLERSVNSVDAAETKVMTVQIRRQVLGAYLSDKEGNQVSDESRYVTLDLAVSYDLEQHADVASPFKFNETLFHFDWMDAYEVTVTDLGLELESEFDTKASITLDAINNRLAPEVSAFQNRGTYSGLYQNPMTHKMDPLALQYAAYEPVYADDSEIAPLIVWLHGQGEGGTDIDIALLGNEVVALSRPEIQTQFKTGNRTGAHVLVVQTPTYWMDEGDHTNGPGAGKSLFTEILMDTIQQYVNQNEHVDSHRVYIGGCSNGGYMTINMLLHYPNYFAAAFPICPAYSFYGFKRNKDRTYRTTSDKYGKSRYVSSNEPSLTDELLSSFVHVPIWFIHAATDHQVAPFLTTEPTYRRLLNLGAENAWFSYFETVRGLDIQDEKYSSHASWIYFFNNEVTGVQDAESVKGSGQYKPSDTLKGGKSKATDGEEAFETIFEWMNEQRR